MSDELEREDVQEETPNIDLSAGEDELDSALKASDETGEKALPSDEDADKQTNQDDNKTETGDRTPETDEKPEEKEPGNEDQEAGTKEKDEPDLDPAEKRLKDLHDGYTRVNEENIRLKQEKLDAQRKYIEQLKAKVEWEKLTEDEEDDLLAEDPEAYQEYKRAEKANESAQTEIDQAEKDLSIEQYQVAISHVQNTVADFAVDIGIVNDDMTPEQYRDTLADFMQSDELKKVGDELRANGIVPMGDYETYTKSQLTLMWNHLHIDAIRTKAKAEGHATVVDNINGQLKNPSKSKLSDAPPGGKKYKPRKNLTQAEVLAMGEDEAEALLQEEVED